MFDTIEEAPVRSRNDPNKENWEALLAVIEKLSKCLRSLSIETDGRTFSLPLDFFVLPTLAPTKPPTV